MGGWRLGCLAVETVVLQTHVHLDQPHLHLGRLYPAAERMAWSSLLSSALEQGPSLLTGLVPAPAGGRGVEVLWSYLDLDRAWLVPAELAGQQVVFARH